MLADIDRALKKATRCEHDFGNWLVILSGDEAEIEAGSDEDVPGGSDPIVRALGRARGGGDGDEAEIEAGSDEDVPGGADPIVRALGRARGGGNGDEAEIEAGSDEDVTAGGCLLYTSPSPRDQRGSRMPSSA